MMFVDGENLAIQWQHQLGNDKQQSHVECEPNVFVWSRFLNMRHRAKRVLL